jgi:hypothetical protein
MDLRPTKSKFVPGQADTFSRNSKDALEQAPGHSTKPLAGEVARAPVLPSLEPR